MAFPRVAKRLGFTVTIHRDLELHQAAGERVGDGFDRFAGTLFGGLRTVGELSEEAVAEGIVAVVALVVHFHYIIKVVRVALKSRKGLNDFRARVKDYKVAGLEHVIQK